MLDVRELSIKFHDRAENEEVVHGISFTVAPSEIVGIVGESGSGKTMTALAIAGLLRRKGTAASGQILLSGKDLLACSRKELRNHQGKDIGMVFQEPMSSLNPLMRIGRQVEEALAIHTDFSRAQRKTAAVSMLAAVDLPDPELIYYKYPHELSGGMRQRVMIAAAIICHPKLLIADEPTTALDVSVQAGILALLKKINREAGTSILFISHDLRLVRNLCSRVLVMKDGYIVEQGPARAVFSRPQAEYTKTLVASIPLLRGGGRHGG